MPTPFRQRASRRRERGLTANTIVTGFPVSDIQHGNRRTVLIPVKGSQREPGKHPRGDHPKRYTVGMRLAVKEYVPGPTALHVRVVDVQGIREQYTLGTVTRATAKDLGHVRLDAFWRSWLLTHDQDWYVRNTPADDPVTDQEIASRFRTRWAGKLAWLIRFDIETIEAPPRFLARGGGTQDYKTGSDNRWYSSPRSEQEERESDRGYTASLALAADDLGGLTDAEWDTHIGPKSPYRTVERLDAKKAHTWQDRYATAKAEAKERRKDIRSECRRFDLLIAQDKTEKAMRQLEIIEARVFPLAA